MRPALAPRRASSATPANPCRSKRPRQRITVGRDRPSSRAMDELDFPSMALKQRSARETSFWGVWGDWTQASRVRRSSAVTCKAQGMLNTTRACAILLSLSSFNCYTTLGGINGRGTVFAVNTNGTGFTTLYSFTSGNANAFDDMTNSDGAYPLAGLILSGNTLYGTAQQGGLNSHGTVFSLSLLLPQIQYIFTALDNPLGVNGTVAAGISGSNIVGWYIDSNSLFH